MNYQSKDPLNQQIILGVAASAASAIEVASNTGTTLVVWLNNKVTEISPDDIAANLSLTNRPPN